MFTAAIEIVQGDDWSKFKIRDVSSYVSEAKVTFSARDIIIYKSDGTVYRQPGQTVDTISFSYGAYPTDEIEILGLTGDMALSVVMAFTSTAPQGGSAYAVTTKFALTAYTMGMFYERHKKMSVDIRLEKNRDYVIDNHRLLIEAMGASKAAAVDDLFGAQIALNRARKILNQNKIPY